MHPWWLLAVGIALEVAGTICLKYSDGLRVPAATALMYVFYGASLTVLSFAMRTIDVSVAYAVWSGAGLVLVATIGMVWFHEPPTVARLGFIAVVLAGLVGLRWTSS